MKLVIEVPEVVYKLCKEWQEVNVSNWSENIIANGIPLVDITNDEWLKEILRRY